MKKGELGDTAAMFPAFDDDEDKVPTKKLTDNGRVKTILRFGGAYELPKVHRPREGILVCIPAVLNWLVNPFHAPVDPIVARVVAYIHEKTSDWSYDPGFKSTKRPIKAYFYAKTADFYELDINSASENVFINDVSLTGLPTVVFKEFGPYKDDKHVGTQRGFKIKGDIQGHLTVVNELGLDNALLKLCSNIAAESTDRKDTSNVNFTDVSGGGDVNWEPLEIEDTADSETVVSFDYELTPQNM